MWRALFTDSGGTTSNYNSNESYSITFDAQTNNTIDLSINEILRWNYSWDRLGFQVSDDGIRWENANIKGLIRTREGQERPPWPDGGTGTADPSTAPFPEMQGWIIPETQEDLIIAREQIDTPIVLGPGNESIISVANGDDMRRDDFI